MKRLLDQFIGKPETYELKNSEVKHYLGANIPDIRSVLRQTIDLKYKPVDAAMSLVLRAGIEHGSKITFELIRQSVKKLNKSF